MAEQERQPTRQTVGFAIRRHRLRTRISVAPLGRLSNLTSSLGMQLDTTSKPSLTANDMQKGSVGPAPSLLALRNLTVQCASSVTQKLTLQNQDISFLLV